MKVEPFVRHWPGQGKITRREGEIDVVPDSHGQNIFQPRYIYTIYPGRGVIGNRCFTLQLSDDCSSLQRCSVRLMQQ